MAVDERSSPQTGDQLRTKNTDKTVATDSSSACEGAAASNQPEVCKSVMAAEHEVDQTMLINGPRTGRGRRKQCRPVRVCLRHDDDDTNDDVVAVEAKPTEVNSLVEAVGLPAQNVCELCGAEETSQEALAAHASNCRGRSDRESDDVATGSRVFPTRYHELGSELMRGSGNTLMDLDKDGPIPTMSTALPVDCSLAYVDDRTGVTRYHGQADEVDETESDVPLDFTLHSDQLASSASLPSLSGVDVGQSATLFAATTKQPPEIMSSTAASVGPEAEDFCEFCQKRFCNKYYLRKHRHDVHGVTASDIQPPQQHLASSFLPQETLGLPPLTSDALTVHDGFITTSSSSTTAQQLPFQTQLMTSIQPFVLPFQTSTSTTSSLLFQTPPSAADLATSPGTAGLLPGLTSLMLLNPFASSLALLNSPSFLHQTSPAAAAAAAYSASSSLNTLAELQKTNAAAAAAVSSGFGGLCDDVAALGALMNPFLPPSDPAAGMTIDDPLSSSHHCELCRKEFCSAYFLSVHRREKHGIATSTALSDAIRLLAAGNGRSDGVLESLGGGVEPGEKLASTCSGGTGGRVGKSHGDRTSTHAETSRSGSSERTSSDHVCCLCKKQFLNRYGLVLHLLSAHNIRPEGFGLAGELLQLDGVGGRPQSTVAAKGSSGSALTSGLTTTSSGSSKQSDRVSCDVCNKEVCNKYFLKTHKMKVHGLDSVAAAVYNPPPPPLDSTRSEATRSPASVSSSSRQHQQQQQQHDEMRKALLMADSQFSAFASHLDFALKSAASTDPSGSAGFGILPPSLHQQQPGEPMMTASDIFRLFGLAGSKPDDPFLSLGPPPPPLSLQSLLPGADLCDPLTDATKHSKPVELKIPKHVTTMSHHKDTVSFGLQQQQPGRVRHSAGHHNGRHGRDQAPLPQPTAATRQSQSAGSVGPSDQELIQSGIDPEAYCELCQKEFCSKYFLRTHRQKIHGVSASKTDASIDHYRPMSQQPATANPVLQMFPGLPLPTQPLFGSGPTGLLPSAPVVDPSSDTVASVSSQGRSSSSKEAANATRVTCDVCGKELCNKYFLKTHMAKIHGCTTAPCGGTGELDVGDTAQDTPEKRALPVSGDGHITPRSSPPYEKYPAPSSSLSIMADQGNIPPLPVDNMTSHRPHSRNYLQEDNDFQPRGNSENAVSRPKTSSDHPRLTQIASAASETVEHEMENGERSLPETNDDHPSKMDAEHSSPNLVAKFSFELAAQHDTDVRQMRGEKRSVAVADDDGITKRPRTDCFCDSSANIVESVTAIHVNHLETDDFERSADAAGNSGVIQFVSRSKDSVHSLTESSNEPEEKVQTKSSWPGTSTDVAEFSNGTTVKTSESNSSSGADEYNGRWSTTVNGHLDLRRETGEQQQEQPPLMQPFIVRQEPLTPSRNSPGPEGEPDEMTQFAACQLVLPVIRPIHDQLTVEFSVTPVSSD